MFIHLPTLLLAFAGSPAMPQDPVPVPANTEQKAKTPQQVGIKQEAKKADESAEAETPIKDAAKKPGEDRAMAEQLANAESRHRTRTAKLARLAEIAEEKGDVEMAARVTKLQKKNDGIYEKRIGQLNEKYGQSKVKAAQGKVEKKKGKPSEIAGKVKGRSAAKAVPGKKPAQASKKPAVAGKKAENAGKKAEEVGTKAAGKGKKDGAPKTEVQR